MRIGKVSMVGVIEGRVGEEFEDVGRGESYVVDFSREFGFYFKSNRELWIGFKWKRIRFYWYFKSFFWLFCE